MNLRKKIAVFVGVALIVMFGLSALIFVWVPRQSKPLNVVLIVIDTLRADHLGCYGHERDTTPNIDGLASEGLLFTNAISAAPWTTPSVASLLTAQYPAVLGIRGSPTRMHRGFPLLSEILRGHGYATHGVVSGPLLSASLGFGEGFDAYDESSATGHEDISSPSVTAEAIAFLRANPPEKPFFLFLHYFDPHYNYILHPQYDYYPAYDGKLRSGQPIQELWQQRHSMSEDDIRYLLALYDSEIMFTDEYIGRVLDELKHLGVYDNTIIVLTADHGEEFMERGWIGHTITLYQELIHVPLIIKLSKGTAKIVESSVGLIDIMPTVLSYLGLEVADGLDGRSLDLSAPEQITSMPVFSETFNNQPHRPEPVEPIALRSVTLKGSKLTYDEIPGIWRFYDLLADPLEQTNLFATDDARKDSLQKLLLDWIEDVNSKLPAVPDQDQQDLFSPEQIRQLKSLGYL